MPSRSRWALLAVLLFAIEVYIALYVRDGFVRPYLGDVLVVMLLFFVFASFTRASPMLLACGVLSFAFLVEFTQAWGLVHRSGFAHNELVRVVLGDTFQWGDLLCYTVGACCALLLERLLRR